MGRDRERLKAAEMMKGLRLLCILLVCSTPALAADTAPQGRAKTVLVGTRAACDAAYSIAAGTPGVTIRRRTGSFVDEMLPEPIFGCGLAIAGSFAKAEATGDAASRLHQGFGDRDWREMPAYSADGTDGTSFAFVKAGVACLVRGTWDGGAADDPAIPPLDWYKVSVFCTSPPFPQERRNVKDPCRR